ncbi:MAG: lipopolysaccharide transport periplasmic protein LptA [Oxalobacteraceae bacterium]|nr:MAG: lipopolysaccharide transport periplasmic protein LptA [Oxalobacteraceae bacterium]
MNKIFAAAAALFLPLAVASLPASAERADSLKPTSIKFADAHIDEATQTRTFTGGVVLTRGTLTVMADKAVATETPDGYSYLTLSAAPGKFVSFRQKSDRGPDQWFEGRAERIEYDDRAELVKLFSKAVIKQSEGPTVTQEMDSEYIAYDSRKELLVGYNDATGASVPGKGRGTMIYQPERKTAATAPAAPAPAVAR